MLEDAVRLLFWSHVLSGLFGMLIGCTFMRRKYIKQINHDTMVLHTTLGDRC